MQRILIIATSRKTRGGITSVIKAHETGEQWEKYHCHWVQTHRDGCALTKLWYFATALVDFIVRIPFYDLVHFHISHKTTTKRKIVFMKIALLFGKKTIVHFHAFDVESTIGGPYRKRYEYMFRKADKVLVLSGWWKDEVVKHIFTGSYEGMSDKVQVIYNPCPVVARNGLCRPEKIVLYAGSVINRKGYLDLIRAFALIAERHKDWKVVFAGNGEVEKGEALARELSIASQVVFLGWVNGAAKDEAFQKASVFCLPSYAEGFPMAVLDAWAYGLPCVVTPVGGIPELVEDGKQGLIFPVGDVEKLAVALDRMMGDPSLRKSIVEQTDKMVYGMLSVQEINRQLGDIYESLLR